MSEVFSYVAFVHAIAGTAGGSTAMTLMYPLDQIRTYLQVKKSASTLEGTKALFKEEGLPGLYRGLGPVLISLAVSNFVYFYANNLLKVLIRKSPKEEISIFQNLFIASIAGVINVLLTCPLWVANTRLKLQFKSSKKDNKEKPYKGMYDTLIRVAKEEGVLALWSGTVASLILVSNPTINFVVYDKVRQIMVEAAKKKGRKMTSLEIFVNGAIAKAVATVLTYPIQIAQTRLRAHGKESEAAKEKYKNTLDVLLRLYRSDGLLGWFAGMDVKLVQTVLTAAFQFVCYEHIKTFIFYVFRPQKKQ